MKIGKRLALYRANSGHTQESLAASSGLSRPAISAIERDKGGSPTIETLRKLLDCCGVTLGEFFMDPEYQSNGIEKRSNHAIEYLRKLDLLLDSPEGPFIQKLIDMVFDGISDSQTRQESPKIREAPALYEVPAAEMISLPHYGEIAAGDALAMEPPSHAFIEVAADGAKKRWYALKVWGDSMSPAYQDGDTVFLDPYIVEPKNGDVVAALIDGSDSTLKTYSRRGDNITLTPINTEYKPKTYRADRVKVQGVVMKTVQKTN